MNYQYQQIAEAASQLRKRVATLADPKDILRDPLLKSLFDELRLLPADEKAAYGQEVNALRQELQASVDSLKQATETVEPLDVTAPFDVNVVPHVPQPLPATQGTIHPLTLEIERVLEIFSRMGFMAFESRELDDDYHMFGSLNFPDGHPARDDYDTFMTNQRDGKDKQYIAPAHTSSMQHRILKSYKSNLEEGSPIAAVIPGRVFRNEDLDARHEHTFHQLEGIYVDKGVHAGQLIATLRAFLQEYYGKKLPVKTQPFYFPFTEPSFEIALGCPFCDGAGCKICSRSGWIELLGCGMIHPNVLREASIDPNVYTGFAWGVGVERLVMMKYGIEDVRHFHSGKLEFLEQF